MKIAIVPVSVYKTPAQSMLAAAVDVELVGYALGASTVVVYYRMLAADGSFIVDGNLTVPATANQVAGVEDATVIGGTLTALGVTRG